ncbi:MULTISPECIES: potassium channel family protein [Tissierella]|uniref:Trk system potassium uptake protein TrkA n=1 Tax=Tissierella praeacuta DSM 18095 TaxID=1123404 RepID=A0A1M4Z4K4_9FIRM|nr:MULTISPECIES: TrkA family potassium uptake protein [Tissierella]MBU5257390.1 TrkA family potassium uptake protein [Tissierella praeacuta]TCU67471.1 trk system potassium uptake protein TrkA [Tissierella praeacuta]SHF12516.1 trk system potassium uptake protein TrkA [Tissierella praeacuta DSM 18095]SUP00633.1 Ktr system potassium uptake protein A [Tissierella praeacuta]
MKSFVVIGCGRFGSSIARTLYSLGNEVLAIDSSEEIIKEISEEVTHAVQADVMDETVLMDLGLRNFDVAVVAIGSDIEASIMATLVVKDLGIDKVIAKAQSELHGKVLSKIGADKIIFPERDMGVRVAHNLASTNILDFIELSPDYSILEIAALKEWEEKSLAQLRLPSKYGINVMAIKRGDSIKVSPNGEVIIKKDDILVIIGNTKDIKRVEQRAGE